MEPLEIKYSLWKKGYLIKDLGKQLGVDPNCVSLVLHGHRKTQYIREAIASALELPIEQVFPETQETQNAA